MDSAAAVGSVVDVDERVDVRDLICEVNHADRVYACDS